MKEIPPYELLEDVIYSIENRCLYTKEGKLIKESSFLVGPEGSLKRNERAEIDPNYSSVVSDSCVYMGDIYKGWGHFLTEGCSRLWFPLYYTQFNELPKYCASFSQTLPHLSYYLQKANISVKRLNENIKFKKIYLPHASFQQRYQAYKIHKIFHEKVANSIGPFSTKGKILYLSRKKMPERKRKIIGEEKIEKYILKKGGTVIYPEHLSFAEQITLLNEYSVIIGCLGSALHGILFRVNKDPFKMITLTGYGANENYYFVDEIKDINNIYIYKGIYKDKNSNKKRYNMVANIDYIKERLEDILT